MDEQQEHPPGSAPGRRGLVARACAVDVGTAVERCRAELERRRIEVFTVIDHGAGARSAGLDLAPEVVVVFGDPSVGTRLMQVDPRVGIELPLKLLLWEQDGVTQVGFVDPLTWSDRYAIPAGHPVLAGMRHLLDELSGQVAGTP